jgi:hypothetical protein
VRLDFRLLDEVRMTAAVHDFLNSFDKLPPDDQYQAAVEILRRAPIQPEGDLGEDALTGLADELFREMDAQENRHAAS